MNDAKDRMAAETAALRILALSLAGWLVLALIGRAVWRLLVSL